MVKENFKCLTTSMKIRIRKLPTSLLKRVAKLGEDLDITVLSKKDLDTLILTVMDKNKVTTQKQIIERIKPAIIVCVLELFVREGKCKRKGNKYTMIKK